MADEDMKWAVQNGDVDRIKELVKKGTDIKKGHGPTHRTALHIACDYGQKEVVDVLVKEGADINATDDCGNTPLLDAIYEGHAECVEYLISMGADPNQKTPDGATYASLAENKEVKEVIAKAATKK